MSALRAAVGIVFALALTACSLPAPDKEADALARSVYSHAKTGNLAALDASLAPELKTGEAQAGMAQVQALIPPGEPTGSKLVGFNFNTEIGKGTTAVLTHAYEYPGKTVHAETVLQKGPGATTWRVAGFHIKQ